MSSLYFFSIVILKHIFNLFEITQSLLRLAFKMHKHSPTKVLSLRSNRDPLLGSQPSENSTLCIRSSSHLTWQKCKVSPATEDFFSSSWLWAVFFNKILEQFSTKDLAESSEDSCVTSSSLMCFPHSYFSSFPKSNLFPQL